MSSKSFDADRRPRSRLRFIAFLKPSEIRFSQSSIACRFQNGGVVNEAVIKLVIKNTLKVDEFPPIRVIKWQDGRYYTLDNKRLYVFRVAQIYSVVATVRVRIIDKLEPNDQRKFTTFNRGRKIRIKNGVTFNHWHSSWLQYGFGNEKDSTSAKSDCVYQLYNALRPSTSATTTSGKRSVPKYSRRGEAQRRSPKVKTHADQNDPLKSQQRCDSDQKTAGTVPKRRSTKLKTKQEDDLHQKIKGLAISDQSKEKEPDMTAVISRCSLSAPRQARNKRGIAKSRPQTASHIRPSPFVTDEIWSAE